MLVHEMGHCLFIEEKNIGWLGPHCVSDGNKLYLSCRGLQLLQSVFYFLKCSFSFFNHFQVIFRTDNFPILFNTHLYLFSSQTKFFFLLFEREIAFWYFVLFFCTEWCLLKFSEYFMWYSASLFQVFLKILCYHFFLNNAFFKTTFSHSKDLAILKIITRKHSILLHHFCNAL